MRDGEEDTGQRARKCRCHWPAPGSRTWAFSLFWAALVVGVAIVGSATINPLFGRFVHWDWMAGVAPVGFVVLAVAFRRRWV